ncbi:MAG TPA: peptide chain release factor N(5)-glutamine methyltransferase [Pyrinomonadaceae bacterium]|nr:peptide chain release factor N(5)-glutamine methyltransferase [Pyrinomonadaceae bacterium]
MSGPEAESDVRESSQTLTVREALDEASAALRDAGVSDARREAATLLMHAAGRDRAYLFAHDDETLDEVAAARFRGFVARRARGEPSQYVTGRQEFYGRDFEVTPDVLIPRPETEHLVEAALEVLTGLSAPVICDVGTGSGCVAVTLLAERADARGVAVDISEAALRVAARNAERHGVRDRLALRVSDCFDSLGANSQDEQARFDVVVSNPPYVRESQMSGLQREVRDFEPRVALTPGGDGLGVVRRLVGESARHLKTGGHLLFEIGFDQHEEVARMIDARVWTALETRPDLQSIPRVVVLRRVA